MHVALRICQRLCLAVHCFSWLYMAVHGCTWLYMAVPVCTWMYLAVPGCTWLYLTVPVCTWLYLAEPGSTWVCMAVHLCTWLSLPVHGCTWWCLALPLSTLDCLDLFQTTKEWFWTFKPILKWMGLGWIEIAQPICVQNWSSWNTYSMSNAKFLRWMWHSSQQDIENRKMHFGLNPRLQHLSYLRSDMFAKDLPCWIVRPLWFMTSSQGISCDGCAWLKVIGS